MPEISEYHAIKNKLPIKKNIVKSISLSKNFYKHINKSEISLKVLKGSKINKISVYGKNLFFHFTKDDDRFILQSKLGMSGVWILDKSIIKNEKNYHIKIQTNSHIIEYYDPRMFGKVYLFKNKDIQNIINEQKLGLDVLVIKDFNPIYEKIKKSNKKIKSLLLDQSIIAGLGNYLVSEILFSSRINPFKKGANMSSKEISSILESSRKIIKESIQNNGVSFDTSYFLPNGNLGKHQDKLKVYLNKNSCPSCRNSIKKEYIDKRVTYYCPICQKLDK